MVARLLDAGVDPNMAYGNGLTALMWAAGHTDDATVGDGLTTARVLLDRDAKVELTDDRGRDALMIAAERGHAEMVRLLIERGADPKRADGEGNTALTLAANESVRDAVEGR